MRATAIHHSQRDRPRGEEVVQVDEGRGEVVGRNLRVQVDEWVHASHVGEQEQE